MFQRSQPWVVIPAIMFGLLVGGVAFGSGTALAQQRPRDIIRASPEYNIAILWGSHGTLQIGLVTNPPPVGGNNAYEDLIEVDPVASTNYIGWNYPTITLITDIHPDHYDPPTIARRKTAFASVIAPAAAKLDGAVVLANGEARNFERVRIEAIPMYNLNRGPAAGQLYHEKGRGNGYVITMAGKRIYVAGDTECTPEMRALRGVDVAFIPMNLPYTMTPSEAAECVKAFKPAIVYPYHYQGSDPKEFTAALTGSGIDVRLRDWYAPPPGMTAAPAAAPAPTTPFNPPRLADGQPDIRGSWGGGGASVYSLEDPIGDRDEHVKLGGQDPAGRNVIVDPPDGKIPYQPAAEAKRRELRDMHKAPTGVEQIDPVVRCFLAGVPRLTYGGARIMQIPGYVVFLVEYPTSTYRVVPIDAGPHVSDKIELWNGDARGHWEGNTLVIETTNHNDRTWFDIVGDFHSNALRVTERWTYVDADTINYSATLDDPKVFARPWTMAFTRSRVKAPEEQWESASCAGNRAVEVILGLPWK